MADRKAWQPYAALIAFVATSLGIVSGIGYIVDSSRNVLSTLAMGQSTEGVPLAAGIYRLEWWFLALAFVMPAMLCCVLAGLLFSGHIRRRGHSRIVEGLAADYDEVCDAVQRIVYHTYNPANPTNEPDPRITFRRIECVFEVGPTGDTRVTQAYDVIAGADPAHFWELRLMCDSFAAPYTTPKDIHFEATPRQVPGIQPVPIDNRGQQRKIALFFLPTLQPRETRSLEVRFDWKGWFGELFSAKRSTTWEWSYRSADPNDMADVTYSFLFDRKCGTVICENLRTGLPGEQIISTVEPDGRIKWTYRNLAAPVAQLKWEFRFKLG